MNFNLKEAAENLLKLADDLERRAQEVSYMICDRCNHTASLLSINEKRKKIASDLKFDSVKDVTVEDKITCPACDGTMSYIATDESSRYYVESAESDIFDSVPEGTPEQELPPPEEEPKKKKPMMSPEEPGLEPEGEAPPAAPSSVFEPVDEQKKKEEMPEGEEPPLDISPEGDTPPEGIPGEDKPLDLPSEEGKPSKNEEPEADMPPVDEGGEPPVVEEEVPPEGEKKPKKKKKEEVEFPKSDVPKFEKMPKDASDLYQASLRKYMF